MHNPNIHILNVGGELLLGGAYLHIVLIEIIVFPNFTPQ